MKTRASVLVTLNIHGGKDSATSANPCSRSFRAMIPKVALIPLLSFHDRNTWYVDSILPLHVLSYSLWMLLTLSGWRTSLHKALCFGELECVFCAICINSTLLTALLESYTLESVAPPISVVCRLRVTKTIFLFDKT